MTTPDNITKLEPNQIFVFGSNKNGNHAGGAAKTAKELFGAIEGVGEGLNGQSYAFPTLDENMVKVSAESLIKSKKLLFTEAKNNPEKLFFVTKLGCGIAGFTEEEMKEIFAGEKPKNIILPAGWSKFRGFKAFEKGLICRGFQYEFGKDFYHEGKIELCESGFHFCKSLSDVYSYYQFGKDIVICEIESEGEVIDENDSEKSVTNHIKLVRVLNPEEASNNNGINNLGHSNTGDSNTGHWNTGHSNTGHSNTGHWNTGDRNTGDWNISDFNNGHFNTQEVREIFVFNKICKKKDWEKARKPDCLYFHVNIWVDYEDMTAKEKKEIRSSEFTGGYMKKLDYKEAFTESLKKATKEEIELIKELPNFDADIFEEISGFRIV